VRSLARTPRGKRIAVVKGQDNGRFMDVYHNVLTVSWPVFVLQLAGLFLSINLIFALLYTADRGGIANARPGNFVDDFFFSVQTLGTLGLWRDGAAHALCQFVGHCGKLHRHFDYRPLHRHHLRAVFRGPSRGCCLAASQWWRRSTAVPTLMFRAANQRGEAISRCRHYRFARTPIHDAGRCGYAPLSGIELLRSSTPLFALSWTVMHQIDETSPLYGLTPDEMTAQEMELVIMLSGLDETIADRIYTRHAYWAREILWNRRFVDVISTHFSGAGSWTSTNFNDTKELHSD